MGTIEGIPTCHEGTDFRSRLEAKWSEVFTLLGWDWLYEPFDLDGWIPDFLIRGEKHDLVVDIKPVGNYRTNRSYREIIKKMESATAGCRGDYRLAILGCEPQDYECLVGWLDEPNYGWDFARFSTTNDSRKLGICQVHGSWEDVFTGEPAKRLSTDDGYRVQFVFKDALNRVQWNKRQPTHIAGPLRRWLP